MSSGESTLCQYYIISSVSSEEVSALNAFFYLLSKVLQLLTSLLIDPSFLIIGNPKLQISFCGVTCVVSGVAIQLEFRSGFFELDFILPRDKRSKEPGNSFASTVLKVHSFSAGSNLFFSGPELRVVSCV